MYVYNNDAEGFFRDPLDWAFGGGGQQAYLFNAQDVFYAETVGDGIRDIVGDLNTVHCLVTK